jgi:crotonobetainyl-CoA:carnitine CoA-transferase CaiB-like acyl-CoA transferase
MKLAPLAPIRILDFSWVLAGPFATRLVADFGAEVIKVQPPMPENADSFSRAYDQNWNRNKRGITLDLAKPEGVALARKLIGLSDAVVENFSPRVMDNWGLTYGSLRGVRRDIILLSLSAMGHDGPWRDYVGFGPTIQAFSGLTAQTAYPGGKPLGIGISLADHVAGLYASLALQAALEYRRKTGRGQFIDLSQLESMTSLLSDAFLGEALPASAPCGVYPCRGVDRWCAIEVRNEEEWANLKTALDNPAWAERRIFASPEKRLTHRKELDRQLAEWTSQFSAEEVMATLQKCGVPAGVVQDAFDLSQDPQLAARGFFLRARDRYRQDAVSEASPFRLGDVAPVYRPAPGRGQDNDYVYRRLLGLKKLEIEKLKKAGVI